jgi:Aldehyde oxidase and xanthine dehydrogenase, a/b hammerhead domain/Esterase FrsA-like
MTVQIGRSIPRLEERAKVTGRAEYAHNLRLPGMLYGKVFRSTVAHGRIRAIDTGAAAALDGVIRVVTGEDIRKLIPSPYYGPAFHDQPILTHDKVRCRVAPGAMADQRIKHAANWLARFTVNGVPASDFHDVLASIERWEDWCRAWSARAKVHEALGHEALAERHFVSAGEHFSRAAAIYHFAKFLFVNDITQMRAAHRRAVACLTLALPHLDPPGERVTIPYEGKHLAATLRRPNGIARPPLVVMTMGLDSTKEELLTFEDNFLRRGMAILAFDGPGQGEAEYDFPIRADYEAVTRVVIDWVEGERRDIDNTRIGIWASASAAITRRAAPRSKSASRPASPIAGRGISARCGTACRS